MESREDTGISIWWQARSSTAFSFQAGDASVFMAMGQVFGDNHSFEWNQFLRPVDGASLFNFSRKGYLPRLDWAITANGVVFSSGGILSGACFGDTAAAFTRLFCLTLVRLRMVVHDFDGDAM